LRAIAGPDRVVLQTQVPVRGEGLTTVADFAVSEGDFVPFVSTYSPSHLPPHEPVNPRKALKDTEEYWKAWSSKGTYRGEWQSAVNRSLITLKALTYRPTGGIVAAATTSLPEQLGGQRNWDYRYCWLRDATFTLLALMDAGYFEEAAAWRDWLLRAAAGSPSQVQIMYGLGGERVLRENVIEWLPGYESAKPVRIGNAAYGQLQLDVYGEVMDALYQGRRGGLSRSLESWGLQRALIKHLATVWQRPDQGLWEVRGGPQHFTYSKVMAWVAVDRTIKSAEEFRSDHFVQQCRRLRQQIHDEVCEKGFDRQLGVFVQAYGSKLLDASALLIPVVGFLPADDPRVRSTVEQIEKRLVVDGLVLRYDSEKTDDGLPGGEGAFLACSFWLANNYVLLGRHADARKLFERLLSLSNDVGLLSEEYDPRAKRLVGNFPQAFSHVAVVGTAFNLARTDRFEERKPVREQRERV
jgi:GH15 family glucan-1,4-alpha-glucosidase